MSVLTVCRLRFLVAGCESHGTRCICPGAHSGPAAGFQRRGSPKSGYRRFAIMAASRSAATRAWRSKRLFGQLRFPALRDLAPTNRQCFVMVGFLLNLIAQHTKMTREILTTSMSPDASRTKHRSFVCVARPHRTRRGSVLSLVTIALMDEEFDATKFIDQFHQGLFDGRVHEELAKLTQDQISEVALLLAARIKGRMDASS